MVQIVKRKKKGRPSKANLARRAVAVPERDVRLSLRRRNVRYTFDFDDFVEEDDDVEDERREKKLKPLLKLQSKESGAESTPSLTRSVAHSPAASVSSSDYDDDGENRLRKRKIDGDADNDEDENSVDVAEEVRGRKGGQKGADFVPGTLSDPPHGFPLPDKKSLELILDKLQKKDTYGVYAEPVDPEELPDYHDVIEHPMDFATVRKKLGNGSYSTLEQFENDVFLICTNAMLYNAPDTIYYKQARSIQELAKKKFLRLGINAEHSENDLKSEQRTLPISLAKKPLKNPINQAVQEPFVSDFPSGATLATPGDFQSVSNTNRAGGLERLNHVDAPVGGNTSLIDNNLDKVENLLTGRGILSRFGRKTFVPDDNRRATYNISNQPVSRSESVFSTFDGEIKQLVAVGLHGDHSYARSLARFAATLGPVAWKVASKRIEQALPVGFKYGRGWVGDYEPLPTPVLILENHSLKGPDSLTNSQSTSNARRDDNMSKTLVSAQEQPSAIKGKPSWFGAAITKTSITPASVSPKEQSVRGANLEAKLPLFFPGVSRSPTASNANYQQQSPQSRNIEPEKLVKKQIELNCPIPSANQNTCDFAAEKQIQNGSVGTVLRDRNLLQSIPMKQPEINGFVARGLPNGKVSANSLNRTRTVTSCSDSIPKQIVTSAAYFPHGQEQQGLSDPVQLMKMFAENARKQQKSIVHSPVGKPGGWMSIGAQDSKSAAENTSNNMNQISVGSLYNPTRELQSQVSQFRGDPPVSGIHIQPAKGGFPNQAFITPPVQMGNGAQFQNRPMVFPQLMTADLSRLQVQAPCRQSPRPQMQPEKKQESLPPDLNIGFQSPGSPVKQPSGVLVDSQQPDLALQL